MLQPDRSEQVFVNADAETSLRAALEIALACLEQEQQLPASSATDPARLHEELGIAISPAGLSLDEVIGKLRRLVAATPSSASPRFLNQLFGGRDPVATAADMLVPVLNTSMYTYKAAGPQILVEQEVLGRLLAKIGFPEGEGMLLPGGSSSNLTAMLLARNRAIGEGRELGLYGRRCTVYTSELSHYSIKKAAGLLGIGRRNVREIAADQDGRLEVAALRSRLDDDLRQGFSPIMINATAGTTVLGSFDPIRELAAVAEAHGIWFHVDGAFGGTLALCPELRHLLDGCELASSFAWNAHKMMGVPLSCSALLVRRSGELAGSFNEAADYLFQAHTDALNPGTRSIQCGRRNDALKLWAAWQYHGDEGYQRRIRRQRQLALAAAARIKADPVFELLLEPPSMNVCFVVKHRSSAAICDLLDREALLKIGHGMVNGRQALRLVCVNPDLDETDLDRVLARIKAVAARLPVTTSG